MHRDGDASRAALRQMQSDDAIALAVKVARWWQANAAVVVRHWLHDTARPLFEHHAAGDALGEVMRVLTSAPVRVRLDARSVWLFDAEWARWPLDRWPSFQRRVMACLLTRQPCVFTVRVARHSYKIRYSKCKLDAVVDANVRRAPLVAAFAAEVAALFRGDARLQARALARVAEGARACANEHFFRKHPTAVALRRLAANVASTPNEKTASIYPAAPQSPTRP